MVGRRSWCGSSDSIDKGERVRSAWRLAPARAASRARVPRSRRMETPHIGVLSRLDAPPQRANIETVHRPRSPWAFEPARSGADAQPSSWSTPRISRSSSIPHHRKSREGMTRSLDVTGGARSRRVNAGHGALDPFRRRLLRIEPIALSSRGMTRALSGPKCSSDTMPAEARRVRRRRERRPRGVRPPGAQPTTRSTTCPKL